MSAPATAHAQPMRAGPRLGGISESKQKVQLGGSGAYAAQPTWRAASGDPDGARLSEVRPLLRQVVLPLVGALQAHASAWAANVLPTIAASAEWAGEGLDLLAAVQGQVEASWETAMRPLEQSVLATTVQMAEVAALAPDSPETPAGGVGDPLFLPLAMFCRLVAHSYNKLALRSLDAGHTMAAHAFLEAAEETVRTYLSQFGSLQLSHLLAAWTLMGAHGTDLACVIPQVAAGHVLPAPPARPPSAATLMQGGRGAAGWASHRPPSASSVTSARGRRRKAGNVAAETAWAGLLASKGVQVQDVELVHSTFGGSLAATARACYDSALLLQATAGASSEAFAPSALGALAVTYNNLGVLFHKQGFPQRALAQFHKALAVEGVVGHMGVALGLGRTSQSPLPLPPSGSHGSQQTMGNLAAVYQEAAAALLTQAGLPLPMEGPVDPKPPAPAPPVTKPRRVHPSSSRSSRSGRSSHPPRAALSSSGLDPLAAVSLGRQHMANALFPQEYHHGDTDGASSDGHSVEERPSPARRRPLPERFVPPRRPQRATVAPAASPQQAGVAAAAAIYAAASPGDVHTPNRAAAHDKAYARFRSRDVGGFHPHAFRQGLL